MALTYDFDMFSIIPREVQSQFGDKFQELGVSGQMKAQRALFRDPAAVEALQGASEEVKNCLLDSGFGINVYDSGAGPGRYPASDGPARAQVIENLMENLERLPEDVDWNGFDIEAFAMAALTAKPLDLSARSDTPARSATLEAPQVRQAASPTASMDDFFSNQPGTGTANRGNVQPDMDSFFSNPKGSPATSPRNDGPDMDSFFSNTGGTRAAAVAPPPMTAEDIRLSIDTAPPKKAGFGPVKMVMMAVGLFVVVSILGNGTGADKLVEIATGGKMVSVNR